MATTKITSPDLFDLGSLNTSLKLPSGTTAQRPTSPSTGEWRYNTTTNLVEFWDGGAWRDLQSENIPPINSENFNTVLYTGNGSTQSITGVGFQPDFVWVKVRSTTGSGPLADSTRGTGKAIYSNLTDADYTFPAGQGVTSFDADGFSVGDDATGNGGYNGNGKTYVAWCWKANGGTTSSNTDGTITSTVQANTKAAFSVVSYTGNAVSGATIGHGLGVEPDIVIVKNLNLSTQSWNTYVKNVTTTNAQFLTLNTTAANGNTANPRFIPGNFSSSVFSVGNDNSTNGASGVDTYIAYCFASVAGYSKFGSYTGTGVTRSIETGFEPAFLLSKRTSSTSDWFIIDNKRNTTNPRNNFINANTNDAEYSPTYGVNFNSNGFTFISTDLNGNGQEWIYIAFGSDASAAPALADSFANKLYTGTGSATSISGLGFSPSLAWIKGRTNTASHQWFDTLRGATYQISSDSTGAQTQNTQMLTSFDTDGFSLGNQSSVNGSGVNYVAWNWKANPIPTINTDGTIQSIVSANQAAGFSIISYTGNNVAGSTIGHGLSAAPEMVIIKQLDITENWVVGSDFLNGGTSPWDYVLNLNNINAESNQSWPWNDTAPSSSVITIGNGGGINTNGGTFITYAFHSIAGFSKIGSYAGNGTSQTVNLGFEPAWVMLRKRDDNQDWFIFDSARDTSNPKTLYLEANTSDAEASITSNINFTSTGLEFTSANFNDSGKNFIYMAFKANITQYPISSGYMGYLVVAGGAGGGYAQYGNGGGGGAGGLRTTYGTLSGGGASAESDLTLTAGTYTITVGAGGGSSVAGSASTITGIASISTVGGGRAGYRNGPRVEAASGGSGGGGFADGVSPDAIRPGGAGTTGEGFAGADSQNATNIISAGGGGGASAAAVGVNGGDALSVSITGSNVFYAGGGGTAGKANNTETYMNPTGTVTGGAGTSQGNNSNGQAAQANTGSGGGASHSSSGSSNNGGSGGSGIVVLRLNTSDYSGTTTGSPTVTTNGSETILTYTGSGTYVHS